MDVIKVDEEGVGVGDGVDEVVGGGVDEVSGVDDVLMIMEEEVLEVRGVLVVTAEGLLLAIDLDDDTEVLDGDDWVDVVGSLVSVLVVLLDMVNCLPCKSLCGRLLYAVAMSVNRNIAMVCGHEM